MELTDEEFALVAEYHQLRKTFIAAKLAYLEAPDDAADEPVRAPAYRDAKRALGEFRRFWRGIRDLYAPDSDADSHERAQAIAVTYDGGE